MKSFYIKPYIMSNQTDIRNKLYCLLIALSATGKAYQNLAFNFSAHLIMLELKLVNRPVLVVGVQKMV